MASKELLRVRLPVLLVRPPLPVELLQVCRAQCDQSRSLVRPDGCQARGPVLRALDPHRRAKDRHAGVFPPVHLGTPCPVREEGKRKRGTGVDVDDRRPEAGGGC
eukprot:762905-Hanusia_phi.AAC.1